MLYLVERQREKVCHAMAEGKPTVVLIAECWRGVVTGLYSVLLFLLPVVESRESECVSLKH